MPASGFFREPVTPSHAQDLLARQRYVLAQAAGARPPRDASWARRALARVGVRRAA